MIETSILVEVLGRYSKLPPTPVVRRSRRSAAPPDPASPRAHSVYRRLSPDQIAELVAEYEAGTRVATLMRTYDLGKGTVLGILRDHGVQLRNQGLSPDDLPEAISRYKAGQSLAAVGKILGCDAMVIRKNLLDAGVTIRPRNGWTTPPAGGS